MDIPKEFFYSKTIDEIHSLGSKKNGSYYMREAVFLRLLSFSADGIQFHSFNHFAEVTGCPIKQCETIWEYCLSRQILIETDEGFSAVDWMQNNGLLPFKRNRSNLPASRVLTPEPTKDTGTPQTPPKEGQISQAIGIDDKQPQPSFKTDSEITETRPKQHRRQQLVKEAVRANVWLDRDELMQLQKSLSQDELTQCLDLLSDWKGKNNITDRGFDDFKQINKWVIRSVRQLSERRKNQGTEHQFVWDDEFDAFLEKYIKG